jgi:chromosome segregation ATPase
MLYVQNKANNQKKQDVATIVTYSNSWVETQGKFEEQKKVNAVLETNLFTKVAEVQNYSNMLLAAANNLARQQVEAKSAADAAAAELAKRDEKINALETERDNLDKKLVGLNASISQLNTKIAETERKLVASEGDREFLLKELKRMQIEKTDLEKQFNDLAVLRSQVNKLQEELSISRRLDWIRKGIPTETPKGAVLLQQGVGTYGTAVRTNYGLNVEIDTKGGVKVGTNAPPRK